jgi:hypothetical protein
MGMLQQLGSAQNMNVPDGFIDLLMERVAQYLDLDDDKIDKIIKERQELAKKARLALEAQQEVAGGPPGLGEGPNGQLSDKVQAILDTVKPEGTVDPSVATPAAEGVS